MSKKELEKLADEISLRLLATKTHDDYKWLVTKLSEIVKKYSQKNT
jgi:hypothetical protein